MDKKRTALGLCIAAFIIQAIWIRELTITVHFSFDPILSEKSSRVFQSNARGARVHTTERAD